MNKCLFCEKEAKKKYCSISCKSKHQNIKLKKLRKNIDLVCHKCGKKFTRQFIIGKLFKKIDLKKQYCSRSCANSRHHSNDTKEKIKSTIIKKTPVVEFKCEYCKKIFLIRAIKVLKNRKFCSMSCKTKDAVKTLFTADFQSKAGQASANKRKIRSVNEIEFYDLCKSVFDNVLHNERIFNGWDADIILPDFKIAILWNGVWHYKSGLGKNHSLKQVKNRDKIKINEIKKAGYTPYIIKDLGKCNSTKVKQEFERFLEIISQDRVVV